MSTKDSRKPADPGTATHRYLFERSFDIDGYGGASENEPPEPIYSAADLEKARQDGYAEGEAAGRRDSVASIEKQLLNGLGRLVEQMVALSDDQMRFQQDLTERSVELALKATRKMFPALARRDGLGEIDALLTNCLLEAKEEPRIMVRVATELSGPFEERVEALAAAAGYQGTVTVAPDDTFGPADCRIEWSDGGAERIAAHMWREFDAATERIFADTADDIADDQAAGWAETGEPTPELPDEAVPAAPEAELAFTDPGLVDPALEPTLGDPASEYGGTQEDQTGHTATGAPVTDSSIPDTAAGPVQETPPALDSDSTDDATETPTQTPTRPIDDAAGRGIMPEAEFPRPPATPS